MLVISFDIFISYCVISVAGTDENTNTTVCTGLPDNIIVHKCGECIKCAMVNM